MPSKTTTVPAATDNFQDDEWDTVSEGSGLKVELDISDVFIGIYSSTETVEFDDPKEGHKTFEVLHFEGISPKEVKGEHCTVNPGYQLSKAFQKIESGQIVRIKRLPDVPVTGQPSPMKDYAVAVRK
jgi:hypothetical protein